MRFPFVFRALQTPGPNWFRAVHDSWQRLRGQWVSTYTRAAYSTLASANDSRLGLAS